MGHRKIDKVIEEVEEMKRVERHYDSEQQMQINRLIEQVDRLKENLFGIQTAWGQLVSRCIKPLESDSFGRACHSANPNDRSVKSGGDANDPDRIRRSQLSDTARRASCAVNLVT